MEGDSLELGLTDAEGDTDGDSLAEGLTLADGETEGLTEADGDTLADGETDGLTEEDGLPVEAALNVAIAPSQFCEPSRLASPSVAPAVV